MIFTLPTSQPSSNGKGKGKAGACGCSPSGGASASQNGPLVLNGQTTGPIMPMGNNLFQVPIKRGTTSTKSKGKNLYQQTISTGTRAKAPGSRKRGLSGLGQDESDDLISLDTGTPDMLSSADFMDSSDLMNTPDATLSLSYPGDTSADTSLDSIDENMLGADLYSPAISAGTLSTSDIDAYATSPSNVAAYAAQTGLTTTQALQAIQQAGSAVGQLASVAGAAATPSYYTTPTTGTSWFSEETIMTGIPNWVFLVGGAGAFVAVMAMGGKKRR